MIKKLFLLFTFSFSAFISKAHNFSIKEGFTTELVTNNIVNPTTMDIASDGRIFISEKSGKIKIIENGILLPNLFLNLAVDEYGELGLSGFILDKEFDKNGHIYVYYNVVGKNHNRLSRFTANGNAVIPNSEEILLDFETLGGTTHNGGAMRWALDTTLIISIGDGLRSSIVQNMDNFFGKVLRLNRDGSIPTDNPFYNSHTGKARYIYALGLRNPFTFDIHPITGKILANDVGDTRFEEINEITPGANYGWPNIEGMRTNQTEPLNYKDPLYAYEHKNGNCAIVGAAFYVPEISKFPPNWKDQYIFGDYCTGNIFRLNPETGIVEDTLIYGGHSISNLFVSKDGYLYYLVFNELSSEIWRVEYLGSGAPFFTQQPKTEMAVVGENITLNVEALGKAEISYQWYKNNSPIQNETNNNLILNSVVLADSGNTIFCVATNSFDSDTSNIVTLLITQNQRPKINFISPLMGSKFNYGDSLRFEGNAIDPEDGALANTQLEWKVDFHHDEHTHPGLTATTGISKGAVFLPRLGETSTNVWYRVYLKATDSKGLSNSAYIDVHPTIGQMEVKSSPVGLPIGLDGSFTNTNYNFDIVLGNERVLTAKPLTNRNDSLFQFKNWSDGSTENNLTFRGGEITSITANYEYIDKYISGKGDGLRMNFYENTSFQEPSILTRVDPIINYQLDFNSFGYGLKSDFISVRWSGEILAPVTGEYKFSFDFDDRLAFVLDGDTIFKQNWAGTGNTRVVNLVAGERYKMEILFVELEWGMHVKFYWEHPYQQKELVPKEFLYSDIPVNTSNLKLNNIKIFPNPSKSFVNIIPNDSSPFEIFVYNTNGKLVYLEKFPENTSIVRINTEGFTDGIYYIQSVSKNNKLFGKFLKIK